MKSPSSAAPERVAEPADATPMPAPFARSATSAVEHDHRHLGDLIIQAKLTVGPAGDPFEREADAVAAQVVRTLRSGTATSPTRADAQHDADETADPARVQRSSRASKPAPSTPASAVRRIQRAANASTIGREGGDLDADTARLLRSTRSGGSPLPDEHRSKMESAFGADFGAVRVHTGKTSTELNDRIQAKAFTTGSDIYFRDSVPDVNSSSGQGLLAHELTHTIQQRSGAVQRSVIMRRGWPFRKKPKPAVSIGSPEDVKVNNAAPDLGAMGYDTSKVKKLPKAPPGRPRTLSKEARGFSVGDDGVLQPTAKRVVIPGGEMVVMSTNGGVTATATYPDGKDAKYVLGKWKGAPVALPPSVFEGPDNKHVERLGKVGGVTGFLAEGLGQGGDANLGVAGASSKSEAGSLVSSAGGTSSAGATVDYGSMSQSEKDVYDKQNPYDATGEAVSGAAGAAGDWLSMVSDMKGFYDNWSKWNKKEKANAVANGFGSVMSAASSTANAVAQGQISAGTGGATSDFGMRSVKVAGSNGKMVSAKENYSATDAEKGSMSLGMISGGVSAALKVKDAIVNFYTWAKNLGKKDKKGNLAREGVATVQSFGDAAKSTMATVMQVKEFFEGASGVAAQAMPIFGLVLNALEIVKRGMDIYRAKMDAFLVKKDKASAKKKFAAKWNAKMDHRVLRKKKQELEAEYEAKPWAAWLLTEIEEIDDYLLDRDLAGTADKRRNRAILAIVKEAQSVAANIATLAGQAHVAVGFKVSGAATGLGAVGLRKLKQFGRDKGLRGFNQNKTTDKKNERYVEIGERLYADFVDVHLEFGDHLLHFKRRVVMNTAKDFDRELAREISEAGPKRTLLGKSLDVKPQLVALQDRNARLKGRVKAAGLSWREFCAESDPTKRFEMLISGQKKRE